MPPSSIVAVARASSASSRGECQRLRCAHRSCGVGIRHSVDARHAPSGGLRRRRPVPVAGDRSAPATRTRHPLARGSGPGDAGAGARVAESLLHHAPALELLREARVGAACRWGKESSEISMSTPVSCPYASKLLPKAAARHPADAVSRATPRADGNERMPQDAVPRVKKRIGFLSFGHWHPSSQSRTHTGRDALVQSIELAVAAEELGIDGAFFRVHHFARQLAEPVPAARRDRRAHQPHRDRHRRHRHALREPALHGRGGRGGRPHQRAAGGEGRLQLGVSRGSPEPALNGVALVRLRAARGRDRRRPRPRQDRAVPRRDRGRRRGAGRTRR